MYFHSRLQAGSMLAEQLIKYRYEDCAVIALSPGSILVGEQIAASLHCILMMLLVKNISIPGENVSLGGIAQDGSFTYNGMLSVGEVEDYNEEFHGFIDEEKREALFDMNRLIGDGGIINQKYLINRNVILVSDGFKTGMSFDVALDYLKPIKTKKIIVATPFASVSAVDKLHVGADELYILDVKENYMETDHYYDDNNIPTTEQAIAIINRIILNWH